MINIDKIREDFKILNRDINGQKLIYFDNGATTLKPDIVNDRLYEYYNYEVSNVNRGVHYLSQLGTQNYDNSRKVIANFINANPNEIIFTKGTTESINLVALSLTSLLNPGDEIIISAMEHHANIIPWQLLRDRLDIVIKVIPLNSDGEIIYDEYLKLLSDKTKLVSITWISNVTGVINPVEKIIKDAHKVGAKVLLDAAQSIAHKKVDVKKIDCDFLAFSAHKAYGPTGVGVLFGKEDILNSMPPVIGGGDMIDIVTFEKTTYNKLPHKFEAGTPNIGEVIAFADSIKYMQEIGLENIEKYEHELLKYATKKIKEIENLKILGDIENKASIISFSIKDIHPLDIGMLLDEDMIAIRTGHHCAQPLMKHFSVTASARASFSFYNTKDEIDFFINKLKNIYKLFN